MKRVHCTNCDRDGHAHWQCTRPKKLGSSSTVERLPVKQGVEGSSPSFPATSKGAVAQRKERGTSKPKAVGSNPTSISKPRTLSSEAEQGAFNTKADGSIPSAFTSAGSSSGRTAEFDSANVGSNPAPASKKLGRPSTGFDKKAYNRAYMADKRAGRR